MTKRAVVVGINDYSIQFPDGSANLGACVRDAQSMQQLLIHGFGFDPSQIYLYTDRMASSENIRRALRYVVGQSHPGDVACFYYSGHGRRLLDPLHPGRYYESIVPASGQDITDVELFLIANQLEQSVVNFTVILDSCHSGGMHDESEEGRRVRSVAFNDAQIQAMVQTMRTLIPCGICLPRDPASLSDNVSNVRHSGQGQVLASEDPSQQFVPLAKSTLVAGCRADELSREHPSLAHGFLTQSFLDVVNASAFHIDHRNLLSQLQTRVAGYMQQFAPDESQTPQLRGQMNRMEEAFLEAWNASR